MFVLSFCKWSLFLYVNCRDCCNIRCRLQWMANRKMTSDNIITSFYNAVNEPNMLIQTSKPIYNIQIHYVSAPCWMYLKECLVNEAVQTKCLIDLHHLYTVFWTEPKLTKSNLVWYNSFRCYFIQRLGSVRLSQVISALGAHSINTLFDVYSVANYLVYIWFCPAVLT